MKYPLELPVEHLLPLWGEKLRGKSEVGELKRSIILHRVRSWHCSAAMSTSSDMASTYKLVSLSAVSGRSTVYQKRQSEYRRKRPDLQTVYEYSWSHKAPCTRWPGGCLKRGRDVYVVFFCTVYLSTVRASRISWIHVKSPNSCFIARRDHVERSAAQIRTKFRYTPNMRQALALWDGRIPPSCE